MKSQKKIVGECCVDESLAGGNIKKKALFCTIRDLCKKAFPPTAETQTQVFGCRRKGFFAKVSGSLKMDFAKPKRFSPFSGCLFSGCPRLPNYPHPHHLLLFAAPLSAAGVLAAEFCESTTTSSESSHRSPPSPRPAKTAAAQRAA